MYGIKAFSCEGISPQKIVGDLVQMLIINSCIGTIYQLLKNRWRDNKKVQG